MEESKQYWYAYECSASGCTAMCDLRLDRNADPPILKCPDHDLAMSYRARWEADGGGYGSRATTSNTFGRGKIQRMRDAAPEMFQRLLLVIQAGLNHDKSIDAEELVEFIKKIAEGGPNAGPTSHDPSAHAVALREAEKNVDWLLAHQPTEEGLRQEIAQRLAMALETYAKDRLEVAQAGVLDWVRRKGSKSEELHKLAEMFSGV